MDFLRFLGGFGKAAMLLGFALVALPIALILTGLGIIDPKAVHINSQDEALKVATDYAEYKLGKTYVVVDHQDCLKVVRDNTFVEQFSVSGNIRKRGSAGKIVWYYYEFKMQYRQSPKSFDDYEERYLYTRNPSNWVFTEITVSENPGYRGWGPKSY